MSSKNNDMIEIDAGLRRRLENLASKRGISFSALTESVLRAHADEEESRLLEQEEDEQRWQSYLSGGHAVSFETVRGKLHEMALRAARKARS